MPTITLDVEMDEFSDDDIREEYIGRGLGNAQAESEIVIESAFLAARDIPNLPQPIKDLFYKVHGRAMP